MHTQHSFGMSWIADSGLASLKELSYILPHPPIKTYKWGQVQEGRERKEQGFTACSQSRRMPLWAECSHDTAQHLARKHSELARLPGGLPPPPLWGLSCSTLCPAPPSQSNFTGPVCAVNLIKQTSWQGRVTRRRYPLTELVDGSYCSSFFPKSQWRPVKIKLTWLWNSDYPVFLPAFLETQLIKHAESYKSLQGFSKKQEN